MFGDNGKYLAYVLDIMSDSVTDQISSALLVLVLLVVAIVVIGGLAMAGIMGFGMMDGGMMDGDEGGGWLLVLAPVAIIALLLILIPGLLVNRSRPAPYGPMPQAIPQLPPLPHGSPADPPVAILDRRLALGEITEEQYRSMLETIRGGRAH